MKVNVAGTITPALCGWEFHAGAERGSPRGPFHAPTGNMKDPGIRHNRMLRTMIQHPDLQPGRTYVPLLPVVIPGR